MGDAEQEAPPQPASTTRPCSSQEELVGAVPHHGARRSNLHSGTSVRFVLPWTFFSLTSDTAIAKLEQHKITQSNPKEFSFVAVNP